MCDPVKWIVSTIAFKMERNYFISMHVARAIYYNYYCFKGNVVIGLPFFLFPEMMIITTLRDRIATSTHTTTTTPTEIVILRQQYTVQL